MRTTQQVNITCILCHVGMTQVLYNNVTKQGHRQPLTALSHYHNMYISPTSLFSEAVGHDVLAWPHLTYGFIWQC